MAVDECNARAALDRLKLGRQLYLDGKPYPATQHGDVTNAWIQAAHELAIQTNKDHQAREHLHVIVEALAKAGRCLRDVDRGTAIKSFTLRKKIASARVAVEGAMLHGCILEPKPNKQRNTERA